MERVWDWGEQGGKDAGAERMFWGVSGLLRGGGEERRGDNEQQPRTVVGVGQGRRVVKMGIAGAPNQWILFILGALQVPADLAAER